MPKYEIAIAVTDEADLASGHKRKKEGDIIAVCPYPWNWGRKEIDRYLIVIVESTDDLETMQNLTIPATAEGYTDAEQLLDENGMLSYTPLGKRRYSIPLSVLQQGWLPDLDLVKVRDKNYIYQPFKSATQLTQKFDGENGNYLLDTGSVDTATSTLKSNEEADSTNGCLVDLNGPDAIIYDAVSGTFNSQTFKTYSAPSSGGIISTAWNAVKSAASAVVNWVTG